MPVLVERGAFRRPKERTCRVRRKSVVQVGLGFAVLALVAGALVVAGTEISIPITVEEPCGVARIGEAVSGGIPLPEGQFQKDQPFALFDGDGSTGLTAGKEVPVQALPLVVNEKGFLRWVLLDFQTDLKPKEKKAFVLKAVKPSASPAVAVKVTETADGLTLDTGKIKFSIAKDKSFSLFSSTETAGRPVTSGGEAS